ncbi:phage tail protein, partial [Enterococcus italicus]|uniref:phage tail protein n=1 Tax=Enterococcus italicus TaxID=246144 RepID=UPI00207447D3
MINFIDETGKQHSAIVECKKTKGVNGEKSLTGTIYTNDEILEGIGRGWRLQFEDEKYCLTYANPIDEGTRIVVEFDAVHEFFFDLSKSVVYAELNGSNTATAYLDFIFKGSGYEYHLEVTIPAFEKESFGMKNRLDLFKDFVSSTGVEFSVNGKIVRILEKVGSNLSTIVKKGFNLNELRIEKNIGNFITYLKGYGAYNDPEDQTKGRLEVEYLSPLASIYGKLEGDPIADERYKNAASLTTRLKNEIESSYGISVDIDMEDLTKAGYEYDHPHEGDYIMAINKDLGFEQKIRIMSYTTSYDTEGNIIDHDISCGSDNLVSQVTKSDNDFRKNVQAGLENAVNTANQAWISAGGKNTVFTGTDEPTATNKGDIWYQVDGEKTIMKFWNGYEWQAFIDPKAVQQAAAEAKSLGEEAKQAGEEAKVLGNEALEAGQNAVDKATTAD